MFYFYSEAALGEVLTEIECVYSAAVLLVLTSARSQGALSNYPGKFNVLYESLSRAGLNRHALAVRSVNTGSDWALLAGDHSIGKILEKQKYSFARRSGMPYWQCRELPTLANWIAL